MDVVLVSGFRIHSSNHLTACYFIFTGGQNPVIARISRIIGLNGVLLIKRQIVATITTLDTLIRFLALPL